MWPGVWPKAFIPVMPPATLPPSSIMVILSFKGFTSVSKPSFACPAQKLCSPAPVT